MAIAGKPELENGDKMILPSAALAELTSREVQYPMMFRVENPARGTHTHCGVSEFTAAVGKCHLPYWIMENLMVPESAMVTVRNVQLPKGRFVKFQPHSTDFTRISNPRAVLEKVLRTYSALTKGDTLKLQYAEKVYWVDVLEVKPADAVSIIETDLEVDFAPPKDAEAKAKAAGAGAGAGAGSGAAAGGAGAAPFKAGSSGAKSGGVIVIDDDDEKPSPSARGGAAGAGAGTGAAAASASASGLAIYKPAFEGGVGTAAGGPSPAPGSTPQSLAALAALRRAAAAGSASSAAVSKFAKEPPVKAFAGTGYRAGDGTPVGAGGAAASAVASGAGAGLVGVRESKGGDAGDGLPAGSPSLTPSVSAGGVVLSAGARPTSAKPKTLNKFEQARAAKAFGGEGKTIRD